VTGARLLLAAFDAGGTVPPMLGVAAELVRRGHEVVVLADPTVGPSARAAGCAFTPWTTAPHFDSVADQTAAIAAFEHGSPRERVQTARRFASGDATGRFADNVLRAARTHSPHALVVESMLPGLLIGALASGLPCAGLMANLYVRPVRGRPPLATSWSPGVSPLGRLRDAMALDGALLATRLMARPLNTVRARYGLPPVTDLFGQMDQLDRLLVLSSPGFDYPAPLPANVRYVGPQLDDPDWSSRAEDWRPDGDAPLVLVAMSSVYQRQTAMLQTVAAALGSLPVRAVITTGKAVHPRDVPARHNVRVVAAAPHREVLREAAVVVTHAGHGTVMKSLAAGVPLVCLPMGRDQRANARRVLRLSAGVHVTRRPTAARIASAIRRVLDDPTFTANAHDAAQMLAAEARVQPSAADEIEALADPSYDAV